jgi:hypothetical protein
MIRELLALSALLARAVAHNLTIPAFARRRLKKSSIYLSWEWVWTAAAARLTVHAGRFANSANSANRSAA